jgi:hypothetical protein
MERSPRIRMPISSSENVPERLQSVLDFLPSSRNRTSARGGASRPATVALVSGVLSVV